jgi:hypothetical protein
MPKRLQGRASGTLAGDPSDRVGSTSASSQLGASLRAHRRNPPAGQCWTYLAAFLSAANLIVPSSGHADPDASPVAVDLELVIAVDVSSSMDEAEQRVQRKGLCQGVAESKRF